jgi:uncharacterized OB-fold protein
MSEQVAYLPPGLPAPMPDLDDRAYWEFCNRRELRIQRCTACGRFRHPPMPACPDCASFEREWAAVPGTGTVFSYTICHHPVHPALRQAVPYNVVVVMLDGAGDVRLVGNVVDAAPEDIAIGMKLVLHWEQGDGPDSQWLPRWRRA